MDAQGVSSFAAQVLQSARAQTREPTSSELILGFFHAINWTEPWIIGLGVFHVLLLVVSAVSWSACQFRSFHPHSVS